MQSKIPLLFIKPGPVLPPPEIAEDELYFLSKEFKGQALIPVWGKDFFKIVKRGDFSYYLLKTWNWIPILKEVSELLFYIIFGLFFYLQKSKRYQAIFCYGTNKTGLAAIILKFITGAKLIVEIPGNPATAYLLDETKLSPLNIIKHKIANFLLHLVVNSSDCVKLLYPEQLNSYPKLKNANTKVFHALTMISNVEPNESDENYIFFIGYPWHLKGVDILINAFHKIKAKYPSLRLIVAGHCEDKKFFEALRDNEIRIEFLPGLPHDKTLAMIEKCSIFVLPSRTESMGKVLLEAMAFQKPVIGSNVDGIPQIIENGINGLLFEPNNADDLALQLDTILSNPTLGKSLGINGRKLLDTKFSETQYIKKFKEMVENIL